MRFIAIFITISTLTCIYCLSNASGEEQRTFDRPKRSFINPYPRYKFYDDGDDPGEPLFLTPLIENQTIDRNTIKNKARVVGSQFQGVESYSGYLTVDKNYNSNMFFWYFPSQENQEYAPVLLWLQGGPGASSLFGLFTENGPFQIDESGNLQKRNYTWSRTHNLVYFDNPVGTGFSFTDKDLGYARNERDVGRNLHEAVMQLYELFEWNPLAPFWISGESYAGKYVPALAYHIHKVQNAVDTRVHIPLKGIAIGNGLSDPLHQLKYGDYLYQLGLIDEHGFADFERAEGEGIKCIKKHNMTCAFEIFDRLISGDQTNNSIFRNLTGFEFYFNYLRTKDDGAGEALAKFLQSTVTRHAIHVGNKTFHDTDEVNQVELHLKQDIMDTVAPWVAELLETYIVCIYNGQLDIIVAYPLTRNYLQHLKFAASQEYKLAERMIWRVDGEIAGYAKHAGHLIEIMVRNAGHMAPADQPKWMFNLIDHLTHYKKGAEGRSLF